MSEQLKTSETVPLSGRPRRQYNYFYGSTADANDSLTVATNDTHSLIGEALVATDNEEETLNYSDHDIRRISISKRKSGLPWLMCVTPAGTGLGGVLLILVLAVAISTSAIFLMPHSSRPMLESQIVVVPYGQVSRADYGDPVEGFLNMDLFHPTLLSPDDRRAFNFPFPTGAFWTNLVVPSPDSVYSYPIVVYPYAYKWSKDSLQLSYPAAHRLEDAYHHWIIDTFAPELTISTSETIEARYVTKFDPLSVTLRYFSSPESKWETTLVQGSPYTTIKYIDSTPTFKALSTFKSVQCPGDEAEDFHDFVDDSDDDGGSTGRRLFGVCSVEENGSTTIMRGVQFMFTSKEGAYWILFSSEPIVLEYDNIRKTTITASAPFTGVLRLAYIPAEDASDTSTFSSTGLRRLIYHAGVYPTGAQVSWDFPKASQATRVGKLTSSTNATTTKRHATVLFSFETATMTDDSHRPATSTISLLMLALPHHTQILPMSVQLRHDKRFDLTYSCIKGPMTPIVGSVWTFEEPLYDLEFDAPHQDVDPGVRQAILEQVKDDLDRVLPTKDENVYGFGKQVARLAQLAHITYELRDKSVENGDEDSDSLLEKSKELLFDYLKSFLTSDVVDYLIFDGQMGGLVSHNGLLDKSEDFGNGRYNDHHFHYGYLLYASAIMARLDPSFVETYGVYVDAIFHDIAHPTNGDSRVVAPDNAFFPLSRHKSWFDGHSFATGMFPFGDGKSQESSSEAVNCYYGAYLWSLVSHENEGIDSELTDFARLLFAMEIRGAQTYWHMLPKEALGNQTPASLIYSSTFQENYMVGNVGMLDVAVNTWFGNDALYVHMINAIPITAATAILFKESYVTHEYKYLMKSRNEVEMAWRGYTESIHAIIDPNQAWTNAQSIVSYELDAAISKSQVLYWITGRPGFNVTMPVIDGGSSSKAKGHSSSNNNDPAASCSAHSACDSAGISGQCCPTVDGLFLGCCDDTASTASDTAAKPKAPHASTGTTDKDEDSAAASSKSCHEHPDCVDLGLTGLCCPTSDGVMLGCCN